MLNQARQKRVLDICAQFFELISHIKETGDDGDEAIEQLKSKHLDFYHHVLKAFTSSSLSVDDLNLDGSEQVAFDYLADQSDVEKEASKHYSEKEPNRAAESVAHFIKSSAAQALVNKKNINQIKEDQLAILNNIFGEAGLKISSQLVTSLRAEMLGHFIGYALSGLCEQDAKEFKVLHSKALELNQPEPSWDDFLIEKVRSRRVGLKCHADLDQSLGNLYCLPDEHAPVEDKIAAKEIADSCFINHQSQQITVGFVTTNDVQSLQGKTMVRFISGLKLLCEQEFLDGESKKIENPYYGYHVQPFYFHSGTVSNETNQDISKGHGHSFLNMLYDGDLEDKKDNAEKKRLLELLGEMNFWRLLSEDPLNKGCVNPTLPSCLMDLNVFVGGTDTHGLYTNMRRLNDQQSFAQLSLNHTLELTSILHRHRDRLTFNARGQNMLQSLLVHLSRYMDNFITNFQVDPQQWKEKGPAALGESWNKLQSIATLVSEIAETMESKPHPNNAIVGHLKTNANAILQHEEFSRQIKIANSITPFKYQWDSSKAIKQYQANQKQRLSRYKEIAESFVKQSLNPDGSINKDTPLYHFIDWLSVYPVLSFPGAKDLSSEDQTVLVKLLKMGNKKLLGVPVELKDSKIHLSFRTKTDIEDWLKKTKKHLSKVNPNTPLLPLLEAVSPALTARATMNEKGKVKKQIENLTHALSHWTEFLTDPSVGSLLKKEVMAEIDGCVCDEWFMLSKIQDFEVGQKISKSDKKSFLPSQQDTEKKCMEKEVVYPRPKTFKNIAEKEKVLSEMVEEIKQHSQKISSDFFMENMENISKYLDFFPHKMLMDTSADLLNSLDQAVNQFKIAHPVTALSRKVKQKK